MIKKILSMLVIAGMVFFVQCTDDPIDPMQQNTFKKGGQGGGQGGGGGGEPGETAGNNLSFPAILVDGFTATPIPGSSFLVPYAGEYTGMTPEEIAYIEANGPWYAQKVEGNLWQAEFNIANADVNVTFIDWGDVIEVVNPKKNRPFRLEVTLYVDVSDAPMNGYTMSLLANPSSPDEVQGTNNTLYAGNWATVASASPDLIVQFIENATGEITWDTEAHKWVGEGVEDPAEGFGFAPELNVGGKYIYGASMGGWKPTVLGTYRITFFMTSPSSFVHMEDAVIGNYTGNTAGAWNPPENTAAEALIDATNNITYVDVNVVGGGGGGGGGGGNGNGGGK